MSTITSDPFHWTCDQVTHFFRHDLPQFISDNGLNGLKLPDTKDLANQLHDNDLDGKDLLLELNLDLLKTEFAIGPLKQRLSIVHVVKALRKLSQGYAEQENPTTTIQPSTLPTPHTSAPHTPVTLANVAADAVSAEASDANKSPGLHDIGIRARDEETLVQDGAGRKRRKLILAPEQTTPFVPQASEILPMKDLHQPGQQLSDSAVVNGYLPDKKIPIDSVFYGDTPQGQELQHAEPPSEDEDSSDNFDIIGLPTLAGHAAFVKKRMRNMFQHSKTRNITYHKNPAVALYPYSESAVLDKNSRSVTIFQQGQDESVKVYREQDITLSYQNEDTVQVQADLGDEWSFLLEKYGGSNDAHVLPQYGESESGEVFTEMETNSMNDSDDDDDMAEEDMDVESSVLPKDSVVAIVNRTVEQQVQTWRDEKLPKLDKTKARSMWRRAKGKRDIVLGLTKHAKSTIVRLTTRLERIVDNLLERTWDSEKELQMACEVLEPTVYDREYQQWAIGIWVRKEQPAQEVRKKSLTDRSRRVSSSDRQDPVETLENDLQDFIEEDSFEDAQEHIMDDDLDQDTIMPDATLQDLSTDEDVVEPSVTPDSDNSLEESPIDDESAREETPQNHGQTVMTRTASESPDPSADMDIDDEVDPTPRKLPVHLDSDDELLPSPSTFKFRLSQAVPKKASPRKEIIALSSDAEDSPGSPPTLKKEPKKEPVVFSAQPFEDSPEDILKWDYAVLEEKEDRQRLMLKLVFELEDAWRKNTLSLLTGNITTCFDHLKVALACLKEGHENFEDYDETDSEAMRYASRLFCCWSTIDHTLFYAGIERLSDTLYDLSYEDDDELMSDLRKWHLGAKAALQKAERYSRDEQKNRKVVITIPDDDDDDDEQEQDLGTTPLSRKRKRVVQESQPAVQMRAKAAQRAEKYESQHSQMTSFAMLASGEDHAVLIYGPNDVDASKHVYLNPDIAKRLKEHQISGVKFMWRELTAPQDEDDGDGQGCLLAHSMGLGKTAQSLALVVTLAETAQSEDKLDVLPPDLQNIKKKFRILILCPPPLIQNWRNEIRTWCPAGVIPQICCIEPGQSKAARLDDVEKWRTHGGIMLVGYNMFTKFANGKTSKDYTEDELKRVQTTLLRKAHVVIADEVHMLKNDTSNVSAAASRIKTHRRIGLTGTPMSNNTQEIYSLISWVAPGFLGTRPEFKANYSEPIEEGTYVDSSRYQVRKSLTKLAALKEIIAPKLNRADITVLKGSLKSKVEFVLTIPLTEEQRRAYAKYVEVILRSKAGEEGTSITQVKLFGWLAILQLLCNHPKAFREKLLEPKTKKSKKSTTAAELAELEGAPAVPSGTAPDRQSPSAEDADVLADQHISQFDIDKAMTNQLLDVLPDHDRVELSFKTMLVRQIMDLSKKAGDQVLIFSQSIPSLNFLDKMLTSSGIKFGRIQGDMLQPKRAKELQRMQNGELDVLLISTRAGGQGLNIQKANRVIIFDFGFNPTHEEQAVGRAYRLGQTKPVFVYRFVAGGTFEYQLYDKQIFKTGLSSRVVDKKNPVRNANRKPAEWLYSPQFVEQGDIHSESGKDPHVMDKIIAGHSDDNDSFVRGIKTMETLMTDANDEALTAEEQAAVRLEVTSARTRKKTQWETRNTLPPPPGSQTMAGASTAMGLPSSTMPPGEHGLLNGRAFGLGVRGGLPPHPSSTAPGIGMPSHVGSKAPARVSAVGGANQQGPPQRAKEAVARRADANQRFRDQELPPGQLDGHNSPSAPVRITGRF